MNVNKKRSVLILISFLVVIVSFFIALNQGSIALDFKELVVGILSNTDDPKLNIIRDLRMPRVLTTILIGASLSVSGVLLQAIIRNPLADPSIVGISSGASLVSVIILVFFPQLNKIRPLFGFIGGLVACFLVYVLAFKKSISSIRIVLGGIAINTMLAAMTSIITMFGTRNTSSIQMWLTGSLSNITWTDFKILLIYTVIGFILATGFARICDVVTLGEKNAKSLGFNYALQMILITLVAVFLGSVSTSIAGVISFVGLIVPHISRMIIGSNHKYLIPFSMNVGAILLVVADTIARCGFKPIELPVGMVMAVIGGPVFIYLLRRSEI